MMQVTPALFACGEKEVRQAAQSWNSSRLLDTRAPVSESKNSLGARSGLALFLGAQHGRYSQQMPPRALLTADAPKDSSCSPQPLKARSPVPPSQGQLKGEVFQQD